MVHGPVRHLDELVVIGVGCRRRYWRSGDDVLSSDDGDE